MWSASEYFNAFFSIEIVESMKSWAYLAHPKIGGLEMQNNQGQIFSMNS